nr:podocalyxin-like protein 2 [Microcebus murinus]
MTPSTSTLGPEGLSPGPQDAEAEEARSGRPWDSTQVICKDWSNLVGKSYIILNMTDNVDCEAFRQLRGPQLLALVEEVLPRHGSGPRGPWHISLSKPSDKEQHLLMALVGEQGLLPTQDVLSMLGDIRRNLAEVRDRRGARACELASRSSSSPGPQSPPGKWRPPVGSGVKRAKDKSRAPGGLLVSWRPPAVGTHTHGDQGRRGPGIQGGSQGGSERRP